MHVPDGRDARRTGFHGLEARATHLQKSLGKGCGESHFLPRGEFVEPPKASYLREAVLAFALEPAAGFEG